MIFHNNVTIIMAVLLTITASCSHLDQPVSNINKDHTVNIKPINNNQNAKQTIIEGMLFYFQRIALPADSIAKIKLSDISIADISAPVLASETIELAGKQVPIAFKLKVDSHQLKIGRSYSIRGTIVDATGQLIWTTDTSYLIDPGKQHTDLGRLKLLPVSQTRPLYRRTNNNSFYNREWRVENIDNGGVIDKSHTSIIFNQDKHISGSTGCNRYSGFYTQQSKNLSIKSLVVTQRACVPALANQQTKFLSLLQAIVSFNIDNSNTLTLKTKQGGTIIAR